MLALLERGRRCGASASGILEETYEFRHGDPGSKLEDVALRSDNGYLRRFPAGPHQS